MLARPWVIRGGLVGARWRDGLVRYGGVSTLRDAIMLRLLFRRLVVWSRDAGQSCSNPCHGPDKLELHSMLPDQGFGSEPGLARNFSNTALNMSGCWTIARCRPGMVTSCVPAMQLAAPSAPMRK